MKAVCNGTPLSVEKDSISATICLSENMPLQKPTNIKQVINSSLTMGTMSHAKLSIYWSVIHYQVTFFE